MASIDWKTLALKLNPECFRRFNDAQALAVARSNYAIEPEHLIYRLCESTNNDFAAIFQFFGVDMGRLMGDLTHTIDQFKTGNARGPSINEKTIDVLREALLASVNAGATQIRSGHILLGLLSNEELSRIASHASSEFDKISEIALRKSFDSIVAQSQETSSAAPADAAVKGASPNGPRPSGPSKTPSLDQFTIDLTARAKAGKIDPVLGRDPEVRLIIDILTRRRQNNPILTGEAGVGKTAVVEGFAQRIVDGDVPPPLQGVRLLTLDMGLLQAGAGVKGEFENRLKTVIEEVKASATPIIMFIDEAHTLIGAGGAAGQGDAANLLKPALARGELRTIAATTWAEYKKYFEKDPALARRFQVVKVEEPSDATAIIMMRGMVETLENHHNIRILDEAVVESVKLSSRYIAGRQLPDKSVSLLDTACARVSIASNATPPAVEDCRRTIAQLNIAIDILKREEASGLNHGDRITDLTTKKTAAEEELKALETRWAAEKKLVTEIRTIRDRLEGRVEKKKPATPAPAAAAAQPVDPKAASPGPVVAAAAGPASGPAPAKPLTPEERTALRANLEKLTKDLRDMQGENPLMQICVDGQAIAEVIAGWTGIPVGRMMSDQITTVLNLKESLAQRIIGQDHALEGIAKAIRTSRAGMTDPRKPIGVFLMCGTSGTGKTETALALAELLYGGEQNLTVINMSEFKEEHKVSLLMGSPPGYVGYGEGGVLTEAVRRKPYSVVLLDEMEKAHPGVQDIFYQVFDKGNMKDGEGRDINFKNTLIIMTSNAGTDLITSLCADPETRPDAAGLAEQLHPELQKSFKPAFLGRTTVIPYFPLTEAVMKKIIELQLGRVKKRVKETYRADFTWTPEVVQSIADRCKEVSTGGRNVDAILNRTLLPEISAEFLNRLAQGQPISTVKVGIDAKDGFTYEMM